MGAPGCDDAPLVIVPTGPAERHVTLVYPYYENPRFFARQVRGWCGLSPLLLQHLSFIVVDDGSPRCPAEEVVEDTNVSSLDLRVFRIEVDVRWNWLAARNIGMKHAREGWTLLTDMDHVADEQLIDELIHGLHDDTFIYRLSRREHDKRRIHPHPNSWFMTRRMFWRTGGYDETLSGHYGTDSEFRRRCAATAPICIAASELVRHEYVEDSSTTGYARKQPEDARGRQLIRARAQGWRPRVLSFPYHEVGL